jgi:hypothetical protein
MFCPKCGTSDQAPETYCRQCGLYLPDLSKPVKPRNNPEEHVKVNTVLTALTIVACFTLSILLYSMLAFRSDTHPLIYVTAALLLAMGVWHIQTFWRTLLLRKYLKKNRQSQQEIFEIGEPVTRRLLDEADFKKVVTANVTDRTTRELSATKLESP